MFRTWIAAIVVVLTFTGMTRSGTASFSGMDRSALHRKLKSLGVAPLRGAEEGEDE